MAILDHRKAGATLAVGRCAATGAGTFAALLVLCWIGVVFVPSLGSHMFVELFTRAPMNSYSALVGGSCASLIFGALSGALTAFFYNLFKPRGDAQP